MCNPKAVYIVVLSVVVVMLGGYLWYEYGYQDAQMQSPFAFSAPLPLPSSFVRLSGDAPGNNRTSATVVYSPAIQYKALPKQSDSVPIVTTVNNLNVVTVARNLTDMVLPNPRATFPMVTLLKQQWVTDLQRYLQTLTAPSAPVVLVMSNTLYQTVLFNWLIAVRVKVGDPFDNILVIALDLRLHNFLQSHGFNSIFVPPNSVIRGRTSALVKMFTTRVVVVRMINYLGYDALHCDNDAIILKNPMTLLSEHQESDIVGSVGTFPFDIGGRWGFTICMGFILFRSTPQIGKLLSSVLFHVYISFV